LIKQKIKKGLGLDQAMLMLTGAAPMPQALLSWYQKIGFHIQEAYGMTENMGMNTLMPRHKIKLGTVGTSHKSCETRIHESTGEILMKAEYNSWGYYKEPNLTAELFEDGWLKTGDMGKIDEEGYLSIVGRVKDNFKTAKGQYVSPAPIENILLVDPLIEQSCVVGLNLPQPIALIVLSQEGKNIEKSVLVGELNKLRLSTHPHFKNYEHIHKIVVWREEWTVENNRLTPTLKIKRPQIENAFEQWFESWYENPETIIFE
jgi:long-subunit acyl-CoA synthetase (AMP-forming)